MDIISVVVGLLIGLLLGAGVAWAVASNVASKKGANLNRSEQELKAILAQQAHQHIEGTKESIDAIQLRLNQLHQNIEQYENSLQVGNQESDKASFFGEHAGIFLRNNKTSKASNDRNNVGDAPPRDFANKGSGLFVGNIAQDESANK